MDINQYLKSLSVQGHSNHYGMGDSKDIVFKNMYTDKDYLQHLSLPLFKRKDA